MTHNYQVVPFERWHLDVLLDDGQAEPMIGPNLDPMALSYLEGQNSWTLVVDGKPALCGGTMEQWTGRSIGWAYLNSTTGKYMLFVTRGAKEILRKAGPGRIEITARADFPAGQRWARMLGFKIETPVLKRFGPEGEDHIGFVKFQ